MKKIINSVLMVCMIFFAFPMPVTAQVENLYAQSAILMDADSGRVLFEKNGNEVLAMASTTKIMTCIIALENGGLDQVGEVSATAASQPKVRLGVKKGETYYIKDLLYALMLESYNDAAVVIAEQIGGSVEEFAGKMNQKAKEIGCEQTYFITPNGLDDENEGGVHSTTAIELAKIMKYCIEDSPLKGQFLEITRTASYSFADIKGTRNFSCNNHNAFLGMMEGALSGKTGFTGKAGYCYVGALRKDGKTFIVALLACGWPNNKSYKWSDTKKLMQYALEHYDYRNVWQDLAFDVLPVAHGIPGSQNLKDQAYTKVAVKAPEEIRLLLKKEEEVRIEVEQQKVLQAPVAAGMVVGSVKYYLGETLIRQFSIVTQEKVNEISFAWCFAKVLERFQGGNRR